jgi:hypothetical protein
MEMGPSRRWRGESASECDMIYAETAAEVEARRKVAPRANGA